MKETTIMLVCAAGMSTTLLVKKMKEEAEKRETAVDIFSVSAAEAEEQLQDNKIDVMLLGPQVRFMKSQLEEQAAEKGIALDIIASEDYRDINGAKILDTALELVN